MMLTIFLFLSQKAQQRLKLPVAPSLQRLQVYRWAYQAAATPPDHPLLPLIWQKFLQLYLRQPGPEYGYDKHAHVLWSPVKERYRFCLFSAICPCVSNRLAAGGCIGKRFFQASSQAAFLRDLRQRIQEVSDFHHAASQALRVLPPNTPSSDQGDETPNNPGPPYLTSPQLHTELVRYGADPETELL